MEAIHDHADELFNIVRRLVNTGMTPGLLRDAKAVMAKVRHPVIDEIEGAQLRHEEREAGRHVAPSFGDPDRM